MPCRSRATRSALCLVLVLAASTAGATAARAGPVGFDRMQVPDGAGAPLEVGIWYPTAARTSPQRLELFMQDVAADGAPVAGANGALVVMSHGNGGSLASHYDTAMALAQAGFVVAAPTHAGDNYRDRSREIELQDRPKQISATIDALLQGWRGHAAIDPHRIGMFGFSAGGFTTLVSIGGRPDLGLVRPYCAGHAQSFVCVLLEKHGAGNAAPPPASVWMADTRIKAASIAAPALGFTFTRDRLDHVRVPVQLWAAADDQVLPVVDNAGAVRSALPEPPEYHLVPGANHFDFLSPCSAPLAQAVPPICDDRSGFDRTAFHERFDASVVRFFSRTLAR